MTGGAVDYGHLFRLSDDTGLFEHAHGAVPRREHGYCLDDVARGLVVLAREPDPTEAQVRLRGTYLAFTAHAQGSDGAFRNRLGFDRRWKDAPTTGDWWGRAMWGLGSVVAGEGPGWQRDEAADCFALGCRRRSPWLRSMAFAALGAAAVVSRWPDDAEARHLLVDFVAGVGPPRQEDWPWPEDRLTYANASLPDALIAAGCALGDPAAVERGTALLAWLVLRQLHRGHLSPVPAGAAARDAAQPAFDQQPIEVAAIADAAHRAGLAVGPANWDPTVRLAVEWFEGGNDVGTAMHDPSTGGGYDGLTAAGPNRNQGAESTLAWLLTAQLARTTRMVGV